MKATIFFFLVFSWCSAFANVIGSDAQNFNPTTSGLDFVTVQSSETLEPGIINLGVFLNNAVNTLPYFPQAGGGPSQSRSSFNDEFLAIDYNIGFGIMENWDAGISFPFLLEQDVDNTNGLGVYKEGGTEYRLNTKYRFFGNAEGGFAGIFTVNFNRIENSPFAGRDAGPTLNFELAADTTIQRWNLGANFGYRLRDQGASLAQELNISIEPMPDQFIASVAASYLLSSLDTKVIFEIFSSFPSDSDVSFASDRDLQSVEALAGIKHDFSHDLAGHFGGGTELIHGASSPDWRVYAGLNYTFGPLWSKPKTTIEIVKEPTYENLVLPDFFFITGTADLVESSKRALDDAVTMLNRMNRERKIKKVVVEGHTDSVGSEAYNQNLSELRANTIHKYLVNQIKWPTSRLKKEGYGETRPIADNGNFQGRAKNRRVEIKIYR